MIKPKVTSFPHQFNEENKDGDVGENNNSLRLFKMFVILLGSDFHLNASIVHDISEWHSVEECCVLGVA